MKPDERTQHMPQSQLIMPVRPINELIAMLESERKSGSTAVSISVMIARLEQMRNQYAALGIYQKCGS